METLIIIIIETFGGSAEFGLKFWQKCAKPAGLDLVDFTKGLSPWICLVSGLRFKSGR